jgi:MarR family transcriptional regulator, transcriptional regulator for hemolysin
MKVIMNEHMETPAIPNKEGQTTEALLSEYAQPSDSLGYLCRVAFRRFARILESNTIKHGVSSGQWRFLRVLWEEEGIMQRELSRRVDMREPTTVVALKGLEKKGFIKRVRDEKDRRIMRVFLTDKARALESELIPYVVDVNEQARKGLSDEDVAVARRVLSTMAENLAEQ